MFWNEIFDEWLNGKYDALPGGRLLALGVLLASTLVLIYLMYSFNQRKDKQERNFRKVLQKRKKVLVGSPYLISGEEVLKRRRG